MSRMIDRVRDVQQRLRSPNAGHNPGQPSIDAAQFQQYKRQLHNEVLESLDFSQIGSTPREELQQRLRDSLTAELEHRALPLSRGDRERLVDELIDDILGLGPLEPLLKDPDISDILINGPHNVFVEKKGRLHKMDIKFNDNRHLMQVIERIVSAVGRRVDETSPMVDARLADGSRFNAIIPPLALDGPCVSIRRFGTRTITPEDLINFGSCPRPMMEFLRGCVIAKMNIIISGGTGSGKTTLLNVLTSFIPDGERIVTIEDSAELQLQQIHVVRLETRPSNLEGRGEVTMRDLVKNSLRMRPDRVILGEIRGPEAIDMLQAMNTGHEGSLATIHANTPRDGLARMEIMVGMGMQNLSDKAIRDMVSRALNVIVQLDRLSDGTRRILAITEIVGMEGNIITTQDIFTFEQRTVDENGKVRGAFKASGSRPRIADKIRRVGIDVPNDWFRLEMEV